jgi:hypothetical protein
VELGGARWPGSGGGTGELGRCPMKVKTPGSLTGWAHLSARGRRRPNRTSGVGDGLTGPNRVGGGGPRLGWKIRVEAGPKSRKRISELKIEFLNLPRLWKFAQEDLGGILT